MNTSSLNQPFRASIDRADLIGWLIAAVSWFLAAIFAIFIVLAGFTGGAGARQSRIVNAGDVVTAGYCVGLSGGPASGAAASPVDEVFISTEGASIRIPGLCVMGALASGQQGCSSTYHHASTLDPGTMTR